MKQVEIQERLGRCRCCENAVVIKDVVETSGADWALSHCCPTIGIQRATVSCKLSLEVLQVHCARYTRGDAEVRETDACRKQQIREHEEMFL